LARKTNLNVFDIILYELDGFELNY